MLFSAIGRSIIHTPEVSSFCDEMNGSTLCIELLSAGNRFQQALFLLANKALPELVLSLVCNLCFAADAPQADLVEVSLLPRQ